VTGLVVGVVVGVLLLAIIVWLLFSYNRLVRLRNQVSNAWAQVEVQLQRRHNLIPNLVDTVKGYAAHESSVLEAVAQARAQAVAAQGPAQQEVSETNLTGALKSLMAVAEAYPQLKAETNFLDLQHQLTDTENRISYSRQYYNDAVLGMNNAVTTFPSALVASLFRFSQAVFFRADFGDESAVAVSF